MRQFNAPPGWPDPPNARWRPPKRWRPDASWPAAPAGWAFWIDEDDHPVRGPLGRFGGPSLVRYGGAAAIVIALIGLVLVNPFGGGDTDQVSGPTVQETAAAPSTTVPPGTAEPSEVETPSATPSPTPTSTGSVVREPLPTPTPSTPRPSTPTRSPSPSPQQKTTPADSSGVVSYLSCAEVRAAGKAPLREGDLGYTRELDRNGDGVACDRGNS
ncbi:hypothetical protein GCM10009789_58660 [Kribbella sancticallisti]|uniref:Excalibur calcium-binding domain-containing protein n=1 Tax=Kribbella sancticallisti TaxID=460087 RepID=A0ABP4Q2D5_9ACTN